VTRLPTRPSPTREAERRGLLLAFVAFGGFWGAWAAVLPAIRAQAHLSDGQLGLALGAIALSAVPVMPLAGRLVDRFGAGRALPATMTAFALVLPLAAFAHSLATLVVALVLLGLATGGLDVVANTATAAWERVHRDRLMSVAHGAFSVGVLVGSASAGLARQAGAGPLPVLAAVAVLVLVVAAGQPSYRQADVHLETGARAGMSAVLLGIGLLTAGAFLCEDAIQSWSALHLERGLGATPAVSGLGPGLFAGAMAAGRLAGGLLGKRDHLVVGVASALLAVGALSLALAPTPAVALVALVVAGAGTSVLAPVLYSAVGARAEPGRQGADLARVSALGYVGFVAGPPLIGALSAASSLPVALGSLALVGTALSIGGPLLLRPSGKMSS
jgi:MFS family permease